MNYPFENDTSAVIKKLARKSVRFDKKKNLFCLSAIIVAVAMIMMSLLTVQNIIYQNTIYHTSTGINIKYAHLFL